MARPRQAAEAYETPTSMTVDEFIAWPGDGVNKTHQLVEGEVIAMSPATVVHGVLQATLAVLIRNRLSETGQPCVLATEPAVIPRVRASTNMRVPDIGVTCAPIAPGQVEMPEPILLVEVLSPGNQRATRANVWTYASIPSVQEILLVRSTRVEAELLRRGPDGAWPDGPGMVGIGDLLRLETVDLTCPLLALYAGTHLG